MLRSINLAAVSLDTYEAVAGADEVELLRQTAAPLRGARVAHVNATSYGGGVSELLRSAVPLYRALGIQADWLVIPGTTEFFEVTKGFHNALQGGELPLTAEVQATYLRQNELIAQRFDSQYDFVVVHDPQPAPLRRLAGPKSARWVWRCHIDTSNPNPEVLRFLQPYISDYDALVFTLPEFVPPELSHHRIAIIAPGIDPLSPKNMELPKELCHRIVNWTGASTQRPLITQISRFDPWKDPLGVIEVYRDVRQQVPGTQLALLGQMALDDPGGWSMLDAIQKETAGDDDIHVFTNFTGIGNIEVNAFQRISDVVLQKSIREGFGLVVSEALWKNTPVVAGRAGGIPLQMPAGVGGFLATGKDDFVSRVVELLENRDLARHLGALGHERVREHFLLSRLVREELTLLASIR